MCSNNFTNDYTNAAFPSTYSATYNINALPIVNLDFTNNGSSWLYLKQGETIRVNLQSTSTKSGYLNLIYNAGVNAYNYT